MSNGLLMRHRVHGNGMRMRSRLALFLVLVGADNIGCAPAIWHVSVAQASPVGPERIVGGFHRRVGRAARDFTVGWQECELFVSNGFMSSDPFGCKHFHLN